MAALGVVTLVVAGVAVVGAAVVGVRSLPDIARYRRLRKM
jgi:hypothetical protein